MDIFPFSPNLRVLRVYICSCYLGPLKPLGPLGAFGGGDLGPPEGIFSWDEGRGGNRTVGRGRNGVGAEGGEGGSFTLGISERVVESRAGAVMVGSLMAGGVLPP